MLARLRALGVALIRFSGEPRVISGWGAAAEEIFGYSATEAIGRLPEELPIATADVTQRLREALLRIPETPLEYDLRLLRKDGTTFPARVRSGFDFRADGSIAGTCSLVLDTSAARAPGEQLPATSSLGPVAALGTLAIGGIERAELVTRAVNIVAESLAIELVAVFAVDAENGVLRFEGGRGWAGEKRPAERIPLAGSDAAALLRTGTGVVVTDTPPSWTPEGLFARSGARDGISVAIGDPFRPTGVLVAFAQGDRRFSVGEVGFLQATSHVLAAAHERERAHDLETRFQRLSRIEAMGQLTGGIAHDFNNLLGVILNHAAFAREHVRGAGSEGSIDEIEAAATPRCRAHPAAARLLPAGCGRDREDRRRRGGRRRRTHAGPHSRGGLFDRDLAGGRPACDRGGRRPGRADRRQPRGQRPRRDAERRHGPDQRRARRPQRRRRIAGCASRSAMTASE